MNLTYLKDKIYYCEKYIETLNEAEQEFIRERVFYYKKYGDKSYLTPRQHGFLSACLNKILKDHPAPKGTKLSKPRVSFKTRRYTDLGTYKPNLEITAKTRHNRTLRANIHAYNKTLVSQKP